MQKFDGKTMVAGLVAGIVIVAGPAFTGPAGGVLTAQSADVVHTFGADVSVTQAYQTSDGAEAPNHVPPPALVLRVQRWKTTSGWCTAVSVKDIERPLAWAPGKTHVALDNPFLVTRMEYDSDGTPARFFNARGERVASPKAADRALIAAPRPAGAPAPDLTGLRIPRTTPGAVGPGWLDNIVLPAGQRAARRLALWGRYGAPRARVNGLDQHVFASGDATYEVLADPEAGVPVEINVARRAALESRTLLTHETRPDGALVRRLLHDERVSGTSTHAITDVTVTNLTITMQGVQ
jgi:hypothetical protein